MKIVGPIHPQRCEALNTVPGWKSSKHLGCCPKISLYFTPLLLNTKEDLWRKGWVHLTSSYLTAPCIPIRWYIYLHLTDYKMITVHRFQSFILRRQNRPKYHEKRSMPGLQIVFALPHGIGWSGTNPKHQKIDWPTYFTRNKCIPSKNSHLYWVGSGSHNWKFCLNILLGFATVWRFKRSKTCFPKMVVWWWFTMLQSVKQSRDATNPAM